MTSVSPFDGFPRLETERLMLRALHPDDGPAVYRLFADPQTTRYYDLATFRDPAEGSALVDRFIRRYKNRVGLRWALACKAAPADLIGTCGYNIWIQSSRRAVLGFDLAPLHWGQGLMSEALQAILDYGFAAMQLNRVEALILPANTAARRLLEKAGFQREGLLREYGVINDGFADMAIYSLLAGDRVAPSAHQPSGK